MVDLLTTNEAAIQLRVSQKTVLRLIRSGDLKAQKVGRSWRIRRDDLPCFEAGRLRETTEIYLDDNASNPIHPAVLSFMTELWTTPIGNASSSHGTGIRSRNLVEEARERLAARIGARPSEVIFTSGATEANNLILRGFNYKRRSLIVSAGEHASIRRVAESQAGIVPYAVAPLDPSGSVDLVALERMLRQSPVELVSIVAANSETGVLNPIEEIAQLVHAAGACFHCDATQLVGRLPFSMSDFGVDALSLSGHKMSGPQGVGALVARKPVLRSLTPQICGGGQEGGLRSGSSNVISIAGLGFASEFAADPIVIEQTRSARDLLEDLLTSKGGAIVNGGGSKRLPNTTNVRFEGAPGDAVLARTPSVAASLGSACHSGSLEPSPTLLAMGLSRDDADSSIRFSVTRSTTQFEVELAAISIIRSVQAIREIERVA